MSKPSKISDPQAERFMAAARELGCDEDPAHFDEILRKVARHKPPPNAPPEAKKPKKKKSQPLRDVDSDSP